MGAQDQKFWREYLETQDTYGTYEDRKQEYMIVARELAQMGLEDDDLIYDVGAGSCDMDHYLRTEHGWRGKYCPVDGAIDGVNLEYWLPHNEVTRADYVVSIQTIEHMRYPDVFLQKLKNLAARGLVVTTPNPAVVDVLAVDPTHITPISKQFLEDAGATVFEIEFCGRGNGFNLDTLVATWRF